MFKHILQRVDMFPPGRVSRFRDPADMWGNSIDVSAFTFGFFDGVVACEEAGADFIQGVALRIPTHCSCLSCFASASKGFITCISTVSPPSSVA